MKSYLVVAAAEDGSGAMYRSTVQRTDAFRLADTGEALLPSEIKKGMRFVTSENPSLVYVAATDASLGDSEANAAAAARGGSIVSDRP